MTVAILIVWCLAFVLIGVLFGMIWYHRVMRPRYYERGFTNGYRLGWEDKQLGNDKYVEF